MYIPGARERVRLAGRREVFFVLAVDREKGRVDLIPLEGVAYVEHGVPFGLIEPYEERSVRRGWKDVALHESAEDESAMG